MRSTIVSLISFACISGGALCGVILRWLLPDNHLNNDARDVVKLGTGLICTLAALVLGLLINSAKSSLDMMRNDLVQSSMVVIELDQNLASFGPETVELRHLLRKIVVTTLENSGPENILKPGTNEKFDVGKSLRKLQSKLRTLSPRNDSQRMVQSQALQLSQQLAHSRMMLLLDQKHTQVPTLFLVILIFWLLVIFISFGLLAPRNKTVIVVMFVCALSVSTAIYLIMEMNSPFHGLITVSVAPLREAAEQIGK